MYCNGKYAKSFRPDPMRRSSADRMIILCHLVYDEMSEGNSPGCLGGMIEAMSKGGGHTLEGWESVDAIQALPL